MPPFASQQIEALAGSLIVSCQATPESPLNRPEIIAALAQAVNVPGCAGLRINSPEHVRAVRRVSALVILGIHKIHIPGYAVYITPTFRACRELAEAGADIIAIDATDRSRPPDDTVDRLISRIHDELGLPVMADIATLDEALSAERVGADIVATTLAGYTAELPVSPDDLPDLSLVRALSRAVHTPVIAEGRFGTPELARAALDAGAHAVVVGTAITNPGHIASRFVAALRGSTAPHDYRPL